MQLIVDIQALAIDAAVAQRTEDQVVATARIDGTSCRSCFFQKDGFGIVAAIYGQGESPIRAADRLINNHVIHSGIEHHGVRAGQCTLVVGFSKTDAVFSTQKVVQKDAKSSLPLDADAYFTGLGESE